MAALAIALFIIFIFIWQQDFFEAKRDAGSMGEFIKTSKFYETTYFIALFLLTYLLVTEWPIFDKLFYQSKTALQVVSIITSFGISYVWYRYLRWLDVFEEEKMKYILMVFVLSCCSVSLVYSLSDLMDFIFGFELGNGYYGDWWYCFVNIGIVEEFVKILPFLILLKFTKAVDEPFDYIFYGSISALGFAFIENAMYLQSYELDSLFGRTLMASVGHMFDTSVICYGMALSKFRKSEFGIITFPIYFLLAAGLHGFYDFWLISNWVSELTIITSFFFLITIHFWVIMKNNLVNISMHYDPNVKLNAGKFKYKIINALLTVTVIAIIGKMMIFGKENAFNMFKHVFSLMLFTALYISMSFSNFDVIRGYISPLLMPRNLFLPKMFSYKNREGAAMQIKFAAKLKKWKWISAVLKENVPIKGVITQRVVYKGNNNWYLFECDKPLNVIGIEPDKLLIRTKSKDYYIDDDKYHVMSCLGFINAPNLELGEINPKDVRFVGVVYGKGI